jgi:hypothetical protein
MKNKINKTGKDDKAGDSKKHKQAGNTVMHSDITNKSNKEEKDLPGYPYYPPNEDILYPTNNEGRLDVDVENLSQSTKVADLNTIPEITLARDSEAEQPVLPEMKEDEQDLGIVPGTDGDVTEDDLIALGSLDKDMDLGEDEEIQTRSAWPLDLTGDDLDVPGGDADDTNEAVGEEDEENNYYSLGGDAHENLEEPS